MASETLSRLLGNCAELRPLQERLALIDRLQRRYRKVVPETLLAASRVCAIDGTTVVVCANSGPVAAALRQIAPRLLLGLQGKSHNSLKGNKFQELTAIRFEVQVGGKPVRRPVFTRGELPAEKLEALAGRLADSPLKQTLQRIARSPQNRKTREKT